MADSLPNFDGFAISRVDVVIATRGRAVHLEPLVERLLAQTRVPDRIILVGAEAGDLPARRLTSDPRILGVLSERAGLTCQRNRGIVEALKEGNSKGLIAFFDDDFRPDDRWLECMERCFSSPAVIAMTGLVLLDGASTAPISEAEAKTWLDRADEMSPANAPMAKDCEALYGCNMAFRSSFFATTRFDENLPLYGWLEDRQISSIARHAGRIVKANNCRGVHLGIKSGRVSGTRFGYSQISNPTYLASTEALSGPKSIQFVLRALASNLLRSVRKNPTTDYRGRLAGNLLAIRDWISGDLHPRRILELDG